MSQRRAEKEKKNNQEKQIVALMNNIAYRPIIRNFSSIPFNLLYWSIDAIDLSSELKSEELIYFGFVGNVCKNFIRPDGSESKTVNLFSLGFENSHTYIPLCELLTEEKSFPIFKRFFHEVIRSGVAFPDTIFIDYVFNIFSVINLECNRMSFEKYLNNCYEYIHGECDYPPRCLIITDIRFLIATVQKWSCFEMVNSEAVKNFYLYSIILLSDQTALSEFERILQKIFIIAFSQYQNDEFKKSFEEIKMELEIMKITDSYNKNTFYNIKKEYGDLAADDWTIMDMEKCAQILDFVKNIFALAKEKVNKFSCNGNELNNAFYNQSFCKYLILLASQFVIWTKIIASPSISNASMKTLLKHKNDFQDLTADQDESSLLDVDLFIIKNIEFCNEKKKT